MAAFAALRYLSDAYNGMVIYVPLKSAASFPLRRIAVLWKEWVICVELEEFDAMAIWPHVMTITRDLKARCVFLDGYFREAEEIPSQLKSRLLAQEFCVEFLGVTSSMLSTTGVFGAGEASESFTSEPWKLKDYLHAVKSGMQISEAQRNNIGSLKIDIESALTKKFRLAGYSCRFMLDYTEDAVLQALRDACNRSSQGSTKNESSKHTVNTLVVSLGDKVVPVSVVGAALMSHYKLDSSEVRGFDGMMAAVKARQRALLGWLFENEVVETLLAWITAPAAATETSVTSAAKISTQIGSMSLYAEPVYHSLAQEFQLDVFGAAGHQAYSYDFPQDCDIFSFDSPKDIVLELGRRSLQCNYKNLILLPNHYANPFFDLALVRWVLGEKKIKRKVALATFQATVAEKHSCNATIVQYICNNLAKFQHTREDGTVERCPVRMEHAKHHAIVPSASTAAKFRFQNGIALTQSTRSLRTNNKRPRQENKVAVNDMVYRWDSVDNITHYEGEDDDEEREVVPVPEGFVWAEVEVGATLVLHNSLTGLAEGER